MKNLKAIPAIILALALTIGNVFATETTSVDYFWGDATLTPSGWNKFYPYNGRIQGYFDDTEDMISTVLTFKYDSTTVNNINAYKSQSSPVYPGLDVKDNGDNFDAYSISTTAPNCKTDIERNGGRYYYNEAEVVILGTLSANKNYTISILWTDYRQGKAASANHFTVNAEMSYPPLASGLDYNVAAYSAVTELYYGKYKGQP